MGSSRIGEGLSVQITSQQPGDEHPGDEEELAFCFYCGKMTEQRMCYGSHFSGSSSCGQRARPRGSGPIAPIISGAPPTSQTETPALDSGKASHAAGSPWKPRWLVEGKEGVRGLKGPLW